MPSITVTTGSRLHFGLLCLNATARRQFGGMGMMIDAPGFDLTLAAAADDATDDTIDASAEVESRIRTVLARWRQSGDQALRSVRYRIRLDAIVPSHLGYGSGTQLELALGQSLALIAGDNGASVRSIARRLGRGRRSGVGVHGFEYGGFLIDGGKSPAGTDVAPLVARAEFPESWRVVLVSPRTSRGLSGEREMEAFAALAPMPVAVTDRLCRLALLEILPALAEQDFESFSAALIEYGESVGSFFTNVQGGTFADARMASISDHLRSAGFRGAVQSSWGPTVCVMSRHDAEAAIVEESILSRFDNTSIRINIVRPFNSPAKWRFFDDESSVEPAEKAACKNFPGPR